MKNRIGLLLLLSLSLVSCIFVQKGVVPSPPGTAMKPLVAPSVSPTPSLSPSGTPSITPVLTLDPNQVVDIVQAGQVPIDKRSIEPLCLRWEDTDGDGNPEWVGVYLRPGDPPQLEGFVLDGQSWHELKAAEAEQHGLGEYPTCELQLADLNLDGMVEIAVWGHAETTVNLLHLFVWHESRYEVIASFQGDAGLEVADVNSDLRQEIIVRHNAGDGLAWETIHTWNGTGYAWTWERYCWLHADHPHVYLSDDPVHTVISFYLALNDRDLQAAYGLLETEARAAQPYQEWARTFDTTLEVEVGSVHEIERTGTRATVTAQVRSYDNLDGYVIGRLWSVIWTTVREDETWRLHSATSEELTQWETPYFR